MSNISYSTHSHNIKTLNNSRLSILNSILSTHINYLLDFYKSHKIKKLDLQTSYQITSTLLQSPDLNLIKLLSLLTYLQFNNITNSTNLTSLISQLQFTPNTNIVLVDTINENGEVTDISFYFETLEN